MTIEAVEELALRLIDTELEGNRTTKYYRQLIKRNARQFFTWLQACGIQDIRTIGKTELVTYYKYVCAQRTTCGTRNIGELISKATINWRLLALRKVFSALYLSGYLTEDPMHGLELDMPPQRGWKRRPFTEKEIDEFLEKIDPGTPRGLRDRTLFELIYSSGLRVSEAAKLTIGDVDLDRREIIVHGKGNRDRMVPISVVARDFLSLYIGGRINRLEEPVFLGSRAWVADKAMPAGNISQRFHDLLEKFGMDGVGRSTHAVRHSTATHLLDHGASIRHVQELLGHMNIDTTVRYTHVQTGALAKIYRKFHPGEHELFEAVDEAYERRLENLVAGKGVM